MFGLVQPVRAAGAGDKVCGELQRAAECLEPFKETTLVEFNDFLVKAHEAVRTGQWPKPGKRRSPRDPNAANGPALTVEQAAQRVMALVERVNDPDLQDATIDSELEAVGTLGKPDLLKVTQEVGMSLPSRTTREEIMQALRRRIRDRDGSFQQGSPRTGPTPARAAGGHSESTPVGGMRPNTP
jgi:hypothetical protein